ncbi:MAG: hypothetical protein HC803_07980 [Saprospiraceae bacterium]|nr:hypothetical protein [Saprospiraceae bacterium]
MYKTILLIIPCLLIFSCSDNSQSAAETINFDDFEPQSEFDNCLNEETFQLLAAAKTNLEKFINDNLIDKTEGLPIGYQRYCLAWTGQFGSNLDTEILLNSASSEQLFNHPGFNNIWVRLTELGDTTYTEELAYDDNGEKVIVKFIENYWTLNPDGSYYECLNESSSAFAHNYLIKKEYGDVEPHELAFELYKTVGIEQFNNPIIQNIIVADLYLRLIAIRKMDK